MLLQRLVRPERIVMIDVLAQDQQTCLTVDGSRAPFRVKICYP